MIDVKSAVSKAFEYIQNLMPKNQLRGLRLEEVELDESEGHWLITLGFDTGNVVKKKSGPGGIIMEITEEPDRTYREIHIDKESGEFVSMRMR